MPQINIDFGEIPEYEAIPQGTYPVEAVDAEEKTSSTGKQMLVVTFEVSGGEHAGRKIYHNIMLEASEPEKLWRTKKDLKVLLGLGDDEGLVSFAPADVIGAQAMALVTQRVWKVEDGGDGEARPNIKKLTSADSSVQSLF
jgi:hypothetical protein